MYWENLKNSFNRNVVATHLILFGAGIIVMIIAVLPFMRNLQLLMTGFALSSYCILFGVVHVTLVTTIDQSANNVIAHIVAWTKQVDRLHKVGWIYSVFVVGLISIWAITGLSSIDELASLSTVIITIIVPGIVWAVRDKKNGNVKSIKEDEFSVEQCVRCTKQFKWRIYEAAENEASEYVEIECPWCEESFGKIRNQNISGIAVFKVNEEKAPSQ